MSHKYDRLLTSTLFAFDEMQKTIRNGRDRAWQMIVPAAYIQAMDSSCACQEENGFEGWNA